MVNQSPLRLASIDIGSNAIRLFVGQKSKSGRVRVLEDQRASVRLGKDAFSAGYIRLPRDPNNYVPDYASTLHGRPKER